MSAPKHESAGNEVTADGIVHRCSCGWVSPPCFSNAAASCLGIDHRAQAKPTNGEGSVMNTTPPMTDAEFLAYIERTPELKLLQEYFVNDFVRAFHAHEQRVRGEMQAKIDALMLEYCPDEMTPEQVAEWGRHQKRVPEPTAPQLSTADQPACIDCAPEFACWGGRIACCKQPVLNSTEQGEAAEAVGLLQAVKKDLEDRAEDGVVELSSNVWQRLCDFLAKQGGK